jgi:pimeloyl-ACP methyl ester carboxylesterase
MKSHTVVAPGGNSIEYYSNGVNNDRTPLLISMGNWEPAFRGFPLLNRIEDRPCFVLSYRGRGKSSSPGHGYDWQDHALDLQAVVNDCRLDKCVFLAFSKGVSYTLGFLTANAGIAAGLILIDYPAIHCESTPGYARYWHDLVYKTYALKDHVSLTALAGIEKESTYKDFFPLIAALKCPITLFVGTDQNAKIASNVSKDDIEKFKKANPRIKIVEFPGSGHMIFDDELDKAVLEIKKAIKDI